MTSIDCLIICFFTYWVIDHSFLATALDEVLSSAKNEVVVIDYSTTWCGPCKMVAPKYDALSENDIYRGVIFLKCIGDASPEASALMKREGIRSVPAFHLWKNGKRLEVINGARIDEVESAIKALKN